MWTLAVSLALADAAPEVRYHRNAQLALWGGIPAAVAPPVATGIVIALRARQIPKPDLLMSHCNDNVVTTFACVLFFPVVLAMDVTITTLWVVQVVAEAALLTAPLYEVLPALLVHTSWRARRALLDVGEATPGTWGTLGYAAMGLHLGAVGAFAGLTLADADDDYVTAAAITTMVAWTGAVGCGLAQWSVDRHHAHAVGLSGPDAATARVYVPIASFSGRF